MPDLPPPPADPARPSDPSFWRRGIRTVVVLVGALLASYYSFCTVSLLAYRWVMPPATAVQVQRWIEAQPDDDSFTLHYAPVPLAQISDHLEHAVVAAEDGRFYQHHGIDWQAVEEALEENLARGELHRGGSTITQQLVKNLFLTTHSTIWRKALEVPLTYLAELILPKQRILALYLNVAEWGPAVFGAEAAARYHYDTSAAALSRYRAAALAACLPAPRTRRPHFMDRYAAIILGRMRQHGW